MSKNLESLLKTLGIEDDTIIDVLKSDEENSEAIQKMLKAAQSYSRPFIEGELSAKFGEERKTLKGKYFKEGLGKVNKIFGNELTNKEVEDIMNDPENEGKTFDAVVTVIRDKVSQKTGVSETELQKMLNAANGKLSDAEKKLTEQEAKFKQEFDDYVKTGKLTAKLEAKLVSVLQGITSMKPEKAAALLKEPLMKKALLKLNADDEIDLFDPTSPETRLRKSDTEFKTLDAVITELAEEYELPKAASGGVAGIGVIPPQTPPQNNNKNNAPALDGADKIATAFANAGV